MAKTYPPFANSAKDGAPGSQDDNGRLAGTRGSDRDEDVKKATDPPFANSAKDGALTSQKRVTWLSMTTSGKGEQQGPWFATEAKHGALAAREHLCVLNRVLGSAGGQRGLHALARKGHGTKPHAGRVKK